MKADLVNFKRWKFFATQLSLLRICTFFSYVRVKNFMEWLKIYLNDNQWYEEENS